MNYKNSSNSKRIAKNTVMLYIRMFFTMCISLFTSRVVLNTLGVSDFGLFNVVGGVITVMSFLNSGMIASTQRYMAYALGEGDKDKLIKVFSTSINIHAIICFFAVLLGETLGLWFVNTHLNLPEERMVAANWVYQASIISFVIGVMSVPYNAAIIAHEKMSAFAYVSIIEVCLKLFIVYLLLITPFDKLISYSVLVVLVTVFIRLCYTIYCKRHFVECIYHFVHDKKLLYEMSSFAGWSIIGNIGYTMKDQISNIILNMFFGTTINAARGISLTVATSVNTFSKNFTMAIDPQIIKQYSSGNIKDSRYYTYLGSKYSFYLLTIVSIPLMVNIEEVLALWLVVVPKYTGILVNLSLIVSLLYSLSTCVTTAIQATGRIKWFQIGIGLLLFSELPIICILFMCDYPAYYVLFPSIVTNIIALVFRFYLLHHYVEGYNYRDYLLRLVGRCLLVFSLCYALSAWVDSRLDNGIYGFIISIFVCFCISVSTIFIVGMDTKEKSFVVDKLKKILIVIKDKQIK